MKSAAELEQLLNLEVIETNIFRGRNYNTSWGRVFGGQVLAQALHAANETVPENRIAHSMHGYFILSGDIRKPIIYQVEQVRDGGSFTTRRVSAIQNGKTIFILAASFQIAHEGLDHQIEMPDVPQPESLESDAEIAERIKETMPQLYKIYTADRPISFRPVENFDWNNPKPSRPFRHVWLKANGAASDDIRVHQEMLAYASDYNLLTTATLPHRDKIKPEKMFYASLDHAMYFHRSFRMDDWLLYALDSPSASNERGFTRGNIFTRDGKLVASVIQEGLMRQMK